TIMLAGFGLACLAAGYALSFQMPIIKKLWTSSYVLASGGWCLLLLALCYAVFDVGGRARWAAIFLWIGGNAIALYLFQNLVGFEGIAKRLAGGSLRSMLDGAVTQGAGLLVIRLIALLLAIWLARWLYRRELFIRV
ncbi:MAG: hypothetical protein ACK5JT_12570, partial [Hyphomicrobiaceae bacterium]